MILKIIKCTQSYWWYNNHINESFDMIDSEIITAPDGTFIWFKRFISPDIFSDSGILLTDTNYYTLLRKDKLNKLCLSKETK